MLGFVVCCAQLELVMLGKCDSCEAHAYRTRQAPITCACHEVVRTAAIFYINGIAYEV